MSVTVSCYYTLMHECVYSLYKCLILPCFRSIMDALTEALSSSFCVTRETNSTSAPHPRLAQYKSKYSALDQDERRRKFLQEQKK